MLAATPNAASISRSDRCAPSDSGGAPPRPHVPPTRRGLPFPANRDLPPTRFAIPTLAAPDAYGSSPSTPLRPHAAGSSLWFGFGSRRDRDRPSRASAHSSFQRFSVIGSHRSTDSSPVASERRRSKPHPHPLRRPLSIPLHARGDSILRSSQAAASHHPPNNERPLPRGRPSRPTSPPTSTKRSRASEPRRQPQGDGARPFSASAPRRACGLSSPA